MPIISYDYCYDYQLKFLFNFINILFKYLYFIIMEFLKLLIEKYKKLYRAYCSAMVILTC